MSRRKIYRIDAAELKVWRQLSEELFHHPVFRECDFETVQIVALKRNPEPRIVDVDKPLKYLERFIINNGNRSVGKQKLCEILKISRPTLNKWIADEFISRGQTKEPWAGHQSFDLKKVLEELKKTTG
jgi:hypothetical protein